MIWIIIAITSLLLNVAFGFAVLNMIKKVETFEDYFNNLQEGLAHVLDQIRSVDIRGSFEADDEVGLVFKAILGMIQSLSTFLEKE